MHPNFSMKTIKAKSNIAFYFIFGMLFILFAPSTLSAQKEDNQETKIMLATRVAEAPKIDGILDEALWQEAIPITGFTESLPKFGDVPEERTEVRVLYDDKAVYIGAMMYDSEPNRILKQLSVRDEENVNADKFEIYIDPFLSEQNAEFYGVTAAGVQLDARIENDNYDGNWDGVWISKTKITDLGWIAEIKIPYSSLRFPDRDIQRWGINFKRVLRRTREEFFWNKIDPTSANFIQQFGVLEGITKVKPPPRLAFTPFFVTYHKYVKQDDRDAKAWEHRFSGGMDIKYGINESLTLDMSIIPDFGQVQFDDVELNLSPFELRFDENRPFFTEGTELFNRAGLFYSRRVGGRPLNFDDVEAQLGPNQTLIDNPEKAQLLNAMKLSGRNRRGLGIGIFNAINSKTFATAEYGDGILREIQSGPAANYNVFVIDQLLPNNSFVSFINTNVMRFGNDRDANVTGSEFRIGTKNNMFAFSGKGAVSNKFEKDENLEVRTTSGYAYNLGFGKVGGNFLFDIRRNVESKTYDPNDLGFLFSPNEISHSGNLTYRVLKPFSIFNNFNASVNLNHNSLYEPRNEFSSFFVRPGFWATLKNFLTFGSFANLVPLDSYDFFEPRIDGMKFRIPPSWEIEGFISTDYRKALALDINGSYRIHKEWDRKAWSARVSPRIRLGDRILLIPNFSWIQRNNDRGFATIDGSGNSVFARRDRRDITSGLSTNILFSNKMNISIRARHNWALVENFEYFDLESEGDLTSNLHPDNEDRNFNAFNIDVIYRFRFAPGSEINLIYKNSILSETGQLIYNFGENFSSMFNERNENVISFKFLYFLDYLKIQRKRTPLETFED